jgi:predicted acylesterase/phospholipase RssA
MLWPAGVCRPVFPWSVVDGKAYWDGGIVSNSPLDLVTDRIGRDGKQVYIVDLFSSDAPLPVNLMEVMARRDEIVYVERIYNDLRIRELYPLARRPGHAPSPSPASAFHPVDGR